MNNLGIVNETYLRDTYEPVVYLSLVIKGISGPDDDSQYKTIFLNKQLQYENLEELAISIDK